MFDSSGTTGDPKEFELDRSAMVASAQRTIAYFGLEPGERVLLCLPVEYIAGKMMVVRALTGELDLILREPSGRPLEKGEGAFTLAAMVPLQLHQSLKAGDDLTAIRRLLVGGGELHASTRSELALMDPPAVYESFGMTETYTHFALRRINGPDPEKWFRPLEGVELGSDERGCLMVHVPGVTRKPLVTSDLVEWSPDGEGFSWLGRADNLINTGGIKVIPEVVEQQMGEQLGYECLLLPSPDEILGQKLVLLVEYKGENAPADNWLAMMKSHLAPHELPREIIPVKSLPRNASFKPDRKAALAMIRLRD